MLLNLVTYMTLPVQKLITTWWLH